MALVKPPEVIVAANEQPLVRKVTDPLAVFSVAELAMLAIYAIAITTLALADRTPEDTLHLGLLSLFLGVYVTLVLILRAHMPLGSPLVRQVCRRLLLIPAILGIFFQLRWVINAVGRPGFDHVYSAIDAAVFGAPLSVLIEPFQTPFWTEWFGFFYWAYFYIFALYVIGHAVFVRDGERFCSFGTGIVLSHVVAWTTYIVMPGYGPYHFLADVYAGPLQGGYFTQAGFAAYTYGPLKDIFPSLHTGIMVYIAIHAIHSWNRHKVYKIIAPLITFWTLQIVIATMYLRWHYAVDVLAGMILAPAAYLLSRHLTRRAAAWRRAAGEQEPYW